LDRLNAYDMFVLSRCSNVKSALSNWQVFSPAGGVTMNDEMDGNLRGELLCSDPPQHDVLQKIIKKPVLPNALAELRNRIETEAKAPFTKLVAK
jgi:cytochrome P450